MHNSCKVLATTVKHVRFRAIDSVMGKTIGLKLTRKPWMKDACYGSTRSAAGNRRVTCALPLQVFSASVCNRVACFVYMQDMSLNQRAGSQPSRALSSIGAQGNLWKLHIKSELMLNHPRRTNLINIAVCLNL